VSRTALLNAAVVIMLLILPACGSPGNIGALFGCSDNAYDCLNVSIDNSVGASTSCGAFDSYFAFNRHSSRDISAGIERRLCSSPNQNCSASTSTYTVRHNDKNFLGCSEAMGSVSGPHQWMYYSKKSATFVGQAEVFGVDGSTRNAQLTDAAKLLVSTVPQAVTSAQLDCRSECAFNTPQCLQVSESSGVAAPVKSGMVSLWRKVQSKQPFDIKASDLSKMFGTSDPCNRRDTHFAAGLLQNTGSECTVSTTASGRTVTVHVPASLRSTFVVDQGIAKGTFEAPDESVRLGVEGAGVQNAIWGGRVKSWSATNDRLILATDQRCVALSFK
jgi:hypothetical protein